MGAVSSAGGCSAVAMFLDHFVLLAGPLEANVYKDCYCLQRISRPWGIVNKFSFFN
jgi:hypothetical protein